MDQVITSRLRNGAEASAPILELAGEIDLAVAPGLDRQFESLFTAGATSVVVDLGDATFIDSTGLGVLVSALNRCQELGGQPHLIVTEPQILRVLRITGLADAFSLHTNRDEVGTDEGEL